MYGLRRSVNDQFAYSVILEPTLELNIVIPTARNRNSCGNDFTSKPLGSNSTIFASSPWSLTRALVTKKRSIPLSFIYADIT